MADGDEVTFSAGPMDKGIQVNTSDFQQNYAFDFDSFNLTQGIYQGVGPRYGFSPLPGQLGTNALGTNKLNNMQRSEANTAGGFRKRQRILGLFPVKLPDPSNVSSKITTYAAVLDTTYNVAAGAIDVELTSVVNGVSGAEDVSSDIRNGFGAPSTSTAVYVDNASPFTDSIIATGAAPAARQANLDAFLTLGDSSKWYANVAVATTGGPNVPMGWVLGDKASNGDATHAPNVMMTWTSHLNIVGGGSTLQCGIPSEYNLGNFTTAQRAIKVITLTANGALNIEYSARYQPTTTIMAPNVLLNSGTPNLVLSGVTATKDTAGVGYATAGVCLINDDSCVESSSYTAIMIAQKKAYMCLLQDGHRSYSIGKFNQWIDPTQRSFDPPIVSSAGYNENGVLTKSSLINWNGFADGVPLVHFPNPGSPGLLAAGTGVLRANTTYEFTYSHYNKRLNVETNVGSPVKFNTGTDEFVSLSIWQPSAAGASMYSDYVTGTYAPPLLPMVFCDGVDASTGYQGQDLPINHYQIRFYYRKLGESTWLPAGSFDAAYLWFYTGFTTTNGITVCTGALAATTGAEPGAFNDYSPLPSDQWDTAVVYKNRAFWFSQRQGIFSLANNLLAYPGRNSFASPTGEFRGAIVHNYAGQAEQNSRLVIFGTKTNYVGRFTGNRLQMNVQVSPDSSFPFEVDGSDFVCDPWTSATAFSSRAAAIADGVLFYWGPQGIYEDGGVEIPQKISLYLEPTIFTLYDPNKVDEIHAHYNTHTKEVMWFYPPKTADGYATHCLIYNVKNRTYGRAKFVAKIDWTQDLNIETAINTAGLRTIAGCRASGSATVQRAYFFDEVNRAGDMYPTTDFVVASVTTPSTGKRALTLAPGYDATNFGTIAVGDYLTLQQVIDYATLSWELVADNMIAVITAVNAGTGTITIQLPTGANMDTTFTGAPTASFFPVWHSKANAAGLNGITWQKKSIYWTPGGIRGYYYWEYLYLLTRLTLWKSDVPLTIGLGYRSPTSIATYADSFVLTLNSDNYSQVFKRLSIGGESMEGQALKYTFSGIHAGHEWVLQYLETTNRKIGGDVLAQFMS